MLPRYQFIQDHIRRQIELGELKPGDSVPSENQLCADFDVSRMTARKALQKLEEQRLIVRSQGKGSYVNDLSLVGSSMSITNIAEDIVSRGHHFSSTVLELSRVTVSGALASRFKNRLSEMYFSSVLHFDNGIPVQWEKRWVNPKLVPDYLTQDFTRQTTHRYLCECAPLMSATSSISAINADEQMTKHLDINSNDACLKVERITSSNDGEVSFVQLIHPGTRYTLGAEFKMK